MADPGNNRKPRYESSRGYYPARETSLPKQTTSGFVFNTNSTTVTDNYGVSTRCVIQTQCIGGTSVYLAALRSRSNAVRWIEYGHNFRFKIGTHKKVTSQGGPEQTYPAPVVFDARSGYGVATLLIDGEQDISFPYDDEGDLFYQARNFYTGAGFEDTHYRLCYTKTPQGIWQLLCPLASSVGRLKQLAGDFSESVIIELMNKKAVEIHYVL